MGSLHDLNEQIAAERRRLAGEQQLETGGGNGHSPGMDDGRLAKVEGAVEGLREGIVSLRWAITLLAAVAIGGFAFLGTQSVRLENRIDRLADKFDAIPGVLREEFGRMRAEMAAQTSAIANAVTAAKQTPPQVILMPAPPAPAPEPPKQ